KAFRSAAVNDHQSTPPVACLSLFTRDPVSNLCPECVARDREAQALGIPHAEGHDSYDSTVAGEQRAARISWVDRGVELHGGNLGRKIESDAAAYCADSPERGCPCQATRLADSHHLVAHAKS